MFGSLFAISTPMRPTGARRQSRTHPLPRLAGVERAEQAAVRSAADVPPAAPPPFVSPREQRAAVGVERHVNHAGVGVDEEHLAPRLAAINGLEQPALVVRPPQMTERGDVDDVGIGGVNDDAADVVALLQAHVAPRGAAVHRLVDAVAPRRALTVVRLAGAGPDDVAVRGRDGDVANRECAAICVEHRRPRDAGVDRLEDAARGRGHEHDRAGCRRRPRCRRCGRRTTRGRCAATRGRRHRCHRPPRAPRLAAAGWTP